jgi:hypothetical protein
VHDAGRAPNTSTGGQLADAGINAHEDALAETINGLYKAEVIHRRPP